MDFYQIEGKKKTLHKKFDNRQFCYFEKTLIIFLKIKASDKII